MIPLNIEDHTILDWVKPKPFRREFELRLRKDMVGSLRFVQDDYHLAIAETANGVWLFRETRYVIPRISIWTQNQQYIASFEGSRSGKGNLEFLNGQKYRWDYKDFLQTDWVFLNSDGVEIMCYRTTSGRGKVRGKLAISSIGNKIQELPLLCLLGWNIVFFLEELESGFFT